jgi:hypothetical protein
VVVVVVGGRQYKLIIQMSEQQSNHNLPFITANANGIKFSLWNRKFIRRRVEAAQHGSTAGHTREAK